MKDIYDFIKSFDLHTIIVVAIAFWWLNSGLGGRIERLEDKIIDMDRRLSRIEGAFSVRNICMLDESKLKLPAIKE